MMTTPGGVSRPYNENSSCKQLKKEKQLPWKEEEEERKEYMLTLINLTTCWKKIICPVKVCRMTRNGLLIFLSQYRRHHAIICNLVPFPSPSKVPTKVIAHFIFKMFLVSLTVRYITGMKKHSTNACAVETVSKNVCNQNTKIII